MFENLKIIVIDALQYYIECLAANKTLHVCTVFFLISRACGVYLKKKYKNL